MKRLPHISRIEEMYELVDEIGFLPFFSCEMKGFSLMDITDYSLWWSFDPVLDPWEWRKKAAGDGRVAYGKFFKNRAGFISKEWLPTFANFRRNGYDFDALYDDGKATRRQKLIMDMFAEPDTAIPSFELKKLAGFGGDGEKGYEGCITLLQMQTYLTVSDFQQKHNKHGEPYGWHVGVMSTMESCFGYDCVRSGYTEKPSESLARIMERMSGFVEYGEKEMRGFLK